MMTELAVFTATTAQVLASGSDGDGISSLGFIFLFSGFVFYGIVYFKYRNTDKRHGHESETQAAMLNVRADDRFVKSMKGLSNAKMKGANNREVRARQAAQNPLSRS